MMSQLPNFNYSIIRNNKTLVPFLNQQYLLIPMEYDEKEFYFIYDLS